MDDKRDERRSVWPDAPLVTPWDDVLLWSPPLPIVDGPPHAAFGARVPAQRPAAEAARDTTDTEHANGA
jgi:hypothetical protein